MSSRVENRVGRAVDSATKESTARRTAVRHPKSPPLCELMAAYQQGDISAFERLHARTSGELRRYLQFRVGDSSLAEDLLQECFLQIHCARHTYEASRPFRPWAFAIARHVCAMQARASARRHRHETRFPLSHMNWSREIDRLASRDAVERALSSLPPDRREILVLHHALGFTCAELGSILGIRSGTAKLRIHRAMRRVRQLLADGDPPGDA